MYILQTLSLTVYSRELTLGVASPGSLSEKYLCVVFRFQAHIYRTILRFNRIRGLQTHGARFDAPADEPWVGVKRLLNIAP